MVGRLGLALCAARWTPASFFTAKRHHPFLRTGVARHAKKSPRRNAAAQKGIKLIFDMGRQRAAFDFSLRKKRGKGIREDTVAGGQLWAAGSVTWRSCLQARVHPEQWNLQGVCREVTSQTANGEIQARPIFNQNIYLCIARQRPVRCASPVVQRLGRRQFFRR